MARKVIVVDTQRGRTDEYESDSTTWGKLQRDMQQSFSKKKVVIKSNRLTLEVDDATLPDEDPLILFSYPKSQKGGAAKPSAAKILGWKYNEARSHASKLNKEKGADIKMNGSKEDIVNGILDFYNYNASTNDVDVDEPKKRRASRAAKRKAKADLKPQRERSGNTVSTNPVVDEKLDIIISKLNHIESLLSSDMPVRREVVDKTQQLLAEANEIKKDISGVR